jgi:CheY-like chemotaxis protein
LSIMVLEIDRNALPNLVSQAGHGRLASSRRTVLVATKEDGLRNFDAAICRARGFEVIHARWGDESLQLYREHRPIALVITDLLYDWCDWRQTMRGNGSTIKNGIQLAVGIRKITPKQPIVVQTYAAIEPLRDYLTESLADIGLLHKPYRPEHLGAFLDELKLPATG